MEISSSTVPSVVVASICRSHIKNKPFILPFQASPSIYYSSYDNWQEELLNASYYSVCGWHVLVQLIRWTLKYVATALINKQLSIVVTVLK